MSRDKDNTTLHNPAYTSTVSIPMALSVQEFYRTKLKSTLLARAQHNSLVDMYSILVTTCVAQDCIDDVFRYSLFSVQEYLAFTEYMRATLEVILSLPSSKDPVIAEIERTLRRRFLNSVVHLSDLYTASLIR